MRAIGFYTIAKEAVIGMVKWYFSLESGIYSCFLVVKNKAIKSIKIKYESVIENGSKKWVGNKELHSILWWKILVR